MTRPGVRRAVELLIEQAWEASTEGRYAAAVSVAGRAVEAADLIGDLGLQIQALRVEAGGLLQLGDSAAALARYTRVLALAEDPALAGRLDDRAAGSVAAAYMGWIEAARFAGGIGVRKLFGVLDAADRWLTAIEHRDWRAGVLLERAMVHWQLEEWEQAVAAAEEALAAYHPGTPGHSLSTHRFQLGEILRDAGRSADAEPLYQAILDDPAAGPYARKMAWQGLAWCTLANGHPQAAVEQATTAVQLAETLGDQPLLWSLKVLVAACRAAEDLDTAWNAATQCLQLGNRLGSHHQLYHALSAAVDVALDRTDTDSARSLLDELIEHATALDTDTTSTRRTDEVTQQRQRLTDLQTKT